MRAAMLFQLGSGACGVWPATSIHALLIGLVIHSVGLSAGQRCAGIAGTSPLRSWMKTTRKALRALSN